MQSCRQRFIVTFFYDADTNEETEREFTPTQRIINEAETVGAAKT